MEYSPPVSSVHVFPRQEYWSGLPVPSPGELPDPGIKHMYSALAGGFFTTEPPGWFLESGFKPLHFLIKEVLLQYLLNGHWVILL